jgi:hypothetical protein
MRLINFVLVLAILVSGCTSGSSGNSTPTAEDAKKFMGDVNETLFKLALEASQAGWVSETYITDDTREQINGSSTRRPSMRKRP